ncbi:MAG: ribosome silencing factor [Chloroflexi bacterium]|nr:ribosome silencing factor [Chloroflexota bacterium]
MTKEEKGLDTKLDAAAVARLAVDAAVDKQASDILLLDVRPTCGFADYFVICSAESERQMNAIAEGIEKSLLDHGIRIHKSEGTPRSGWILLDLVDVIVHIFSPEQRAFYQLETLWEKAIPVLRMQ